MPLNRKRPPVTIQVPDVPRAGYTLSDEGTFTEGNLEISRSGMRIDGRGPMDDLGAVRGDQSLLSPQPCASGWSQKSPRGVGTGDGTNKEEGVRGGGAGNFPVMHDSTMIDEAAHVGVSGDLDELIHGETKYALEETRRKHANNATDSSGDIRFDFDVSLDELLITGTCGKGAGGFVQKAVHQKTGEHLAVKIVQMNVQAEVRKNIISELRALHSSRCPYIVQYRGSFFGDGSVQIVLEYMDGGSLSDVTYSLKFIDEKVLKVAAKQILLGLQYLHSEKKIVHRDIKPSNLLVNRKGEVKISDFGVSGQLANSVAKCDSWVGTVTYMSPERIKGESYSFDSDIWSLGLSLLECAIGRFPYPPEVEDGVDEDAVDKQSKQSAGEENTKDARDENDNTASGVTMSDSIALPVSSSNPETNPQTTGTLGFWDLLDYIVREPAPQLPRLSRTKYSDGFRVFVESCLRKTPGDRSSSKTLLGTGWISGVNNSSKSDSDDSNTVTLEDKASLAEAVGRAVQGVRR